METSESAARSKYSESQTLYVTPIANIRTELKLFNAIFHLNMSPLKNLILDPDSYNEPIIPNRISTFQYSGYVRSAYLSQFTIN